MRTITHSQREIIDAVVAETGGSPALLEKDIHVTDVLHAVFKLEFPHSRFVFCGGTSLSKAYGVIERMSEDVDLKIVMHPNHGLSRTKMRSYLRDVTNQVKAVVTELGFAEDPDGARVLNEYRYTASSWLYGSAYSSSTALRPHLSLEFTVREPRFETVMAPITYLLARFGAEGMPFLDVECIATEETLAEKVLSFLRRHSMHRAGAMLQAWDEALVRHIYDIHCMMLGNPDLPAKAALHFPVLVDYDRQEFDKYEAFVNNAKECLTNALLAAESEEQTMREYTQRLLPLIYGSVRPDFQTAFGSFKTASNLLLATL